VLLLELILFSAPLPPGIFHYFVQVSFVTQIYLENNECVVFIL